MYVEEVDIIFDDKEYKLTTIDAALYIELVDIIHDDKEYKRTKMIRNINKGQL